MPSASFNNTSFAARKHLREIFDRYRETDPETLSVAEACASVKSLTSAIIETARVSLTGHFRNATLIHVDEKSFAEEIKLLKNLNRRLEYSVAMDDWLSARRKDWVRRAHRETPMKAIAMQWSDEDVDGRQELLSDIQSRQCATYSDGAIKFIPSSIKSYKNDDGAAVALTQSLIGTQRDYQIPPISICRDSLEEKTPDHALSSGHHEQIHNFMLQLAASEKFGLLPKNHALRPDAQLALTIYESGATTASEIETAYLTSPNEFLSYREQDAFEREFIKARTIGPFLLPGWIR